MEDPKSLPFSLHLPFTTIARILVALLFVFCLKALAPLLMTLFLATLLAVSLAPIVQWLQSKRFPRWLAVASLTTVLLAAMMVVAAIVLPKFYQELSNFIENLPK